MKITLNEDDMREPCDHNDLVTCGTCERNWCGTCNPTPSARCLYEYEHDEAEFKDEPDPELQWGEESAKFQAEFEDEFGPYLAKQLENPEVRAAYEAEWLDDAPLAPHGGCNWAGCTTCFPQKDEVTPDPESELSPREIWDIHNEGFTEEDELHIVKPQANGPCPVCGESSGFHSDDKHRKDRRV